MIQPSGTCEVSSVWNQLALKKASELIQKGIPVGIYNRGVCAIWGDGKNDKFCSEIARIKGERRKKKPLGATLPTKILVSLIDSKKIPKKFHSIFLNAEELSSRIGSLCFIRVPITENAALALPKSMISKLRNGTNVIQNWDPAGHRSIDQLIKDLHESGVIYPAVTSMNISGEPEIVDQQAGIDFAKKSNIPLFLTDEYDQKRALGSYTIFSINKMGIELVRNGNIPGSLFHKLLDISSIKTHRAKQPLHPQLSIPEKLLENLSPYEARITIISHIRGKVPVQFSNI